MAAEERDERNPQADSASESKGKHPLGKAAGAVAGAVVGAVTGSIAGPAGMAAGAVAGGVLGGIAGGGVGEAMDTMATPGAGKDFPAAHGEETPSDGTAAGKPQDAGNRPDDKAGDA